MCLNSSLLLDSVEGNLERIRWIYVSYSIFLVTFAAHGGSREAIELA